MDGDFWVERAVAGAKFLKTLDTQDHGYSIGHVVTIDESGMNESVMEWAEANNIPVTTVDRSDEDVFGKMTDRRTALDMIESAKQVNPEAVVAAIVIQDGKSDNSLAFEIIRAAEAETDIMKMAKEKKFKDFPYHISTTV